MLRCARIGGAAPRLHDRTAADRAAFPARLANHGVGALAKVPPGVGPGYPQVVVLFGATGDLSRRKLLPGLFHLSSAGFIPGCRIIGVSLDEIDADGFREFARDALDEFSDPQGRRGGLGRISPRPSTMCR